MHNPAIVALAVLRMKKTDLVKNLAKKIQGKMQTAAVPGRFGDGAAHVPDRREQRKLDQAAGLVPFAVKLHGDLVKQLQALAAAGDGNLNALVDRLVRAGLAAQASAPAAPVKVAKVAKKAAVPAPAPAPVTTASAPKKPVAAKKVAAEKAPAKQAPAKTAAAKKAAAKKAVALTSGKTPAKTPVKKTAAKAAR